MSDDAPSPDKRLVYKLVGDVKLELNVFVPAGHQTSDHRPAVVFFFGGGWVGGTPQQFFPQCRYLASRGMVAVSAEYRVQSRHGTTPRECVEDGKSAVRFLRAHAADFGIDPDRLAAGGGSAGAHVAAAIALCSRIEGAGDDPHVSCQPSALVLFNPVFDNGPDSFGHERVKEYWRDVSPLHNIVAGAPPTAVFLGTEDKLIPVTTAEAYRDRMRACGARCDLYLYEGQGHGFFNAAHPEHFARTLIDADRFLASLGYLDGAPTMQVPPSGDGSVTP